MENNQIIIFVNYVYKTNIKHISMVMKVAYCDIHYLMTSVFELTYLHKITIGFQNLDID